YDNVFSVPKEYSENGVEDGNYAFVIPAKQRDSYATYEMLKRLEMTEVEIEKATNPFRAGGKAYKAGSYVIRMHQPRANWAHELLSIDKYPEGESLPYAEATSNLPLWLGVKTDKIDKKFSADLKRVEKVEVPD